MKGTIVPTDCFVSAASPSGTEAVAVASNSAPSLRGAAATPIPDPTLTGLASVASAALGRSQPDVLARSDAVNFSIFNSGDGPGIHEPGSMTWGGDAVATAPSGRADDSAMCPAVTGTSSCGRDSSPDLTSSDIDDGSTFGGSHTAAAGRSPRAGIASGPQDPNSVVERASSARQSSLGVSSLDLPAVSSGIAGLSGHSCMGCDAVVPIHRMFCDVCEISAAKHPSADPLGALLHGMISVPPAASAVAGLSSEVLAAELEDRGFFVMEMKATTLRVAASSAIHSSVSIPTT